MSSNGTDAAQDAAAAGAPLVLTPAHKHTPGPWKIIYAIIGIEKEMWPNAIIANQTVCDFSWLGGYDLATQQANAALVAAAPDLLDALKEARDALNGAPNTSGLQAQINDAIARATGAA